MSTPRTSPPTDQPRSTKPAGPRFFHLPGRLAAKADTARISGDDERLGAIADRLEQTVDELTRRRDALLTTPGGQGRQALDRDLEVHRLGGRLRLLRRYGADLCLGRVVLAGTPEPLYVGRVGLSDAAGRRLLVDWRSPAAEPFFAATHADPRGATSRRRYRWESGRVTDYWDEVFTGDDRTALAPDDDSAFLAGLGAHRSARMRDVLATIQADQDAVIRAGSPGTLVVDGGPGTGKTVVALHRAAYLVYAEPGLGAGSGGVLFVGPHQRYLSYVADILPGLGEEQVATCTLRDLVPEGASAGPEPDPEVARLKSSARVVDIVSAAVRFHEQPPRTELALAAPSGEVTVTAHDWAEAFAAAPPDLPHNAARRYVLDEVIASVLDARDRRENADEQLRDADAAALRRDPELRAALGQAWPLVSAADLVADLWSVPAYLRRCAPALGAADIARLQRAHPHAAPSYLWTEPDLPWLDVAYRLLGDPVEPRREQRRQDAADRQRDERRRVVEELREVADDEYGTGLVTMLGGEDFRDALVDEAELPGAEPDRLAGPFAHVVVDEAQELTDAQWQTLLLRCPSRSFTVVGDRAQARHGFVETWHERLTRVGLDRVRIAGLRVNYRTPAEIMAVAEPEIRAVLPDANVPVSVRSSGIPVTAGRAADLGRILAEWLAGRADGIACVVGTMALTSTHLRTEPRVQLLTPQQAKGLEFDLVVLVEPGQYGGGVEGAVDRYVTMTRATQQLVVLRRDGDRV